MSKNWLEEYGIKEVKSKKNYEKAMIANFGVMSTEKEKTGAPSCLGSFVWHKSHGFFIRPPECLVSNQILFELIEKTDLTRLILSAYELHSLGLEEPSDLSYKLYPYDKTVAFDYEDDREWIFAGLETANKALTVALARVGKVIIYRRVKWGCYSLDFEDIEDYGNLVMARGRYSFTIGECNAEKKLDR